MTPAEMYADARRKGFTLDHIMRHWAINRAGWPAGHEHAPELVKELDSWLSGLAGDSPEDQRAMDRSILNWRYYPNGADWDSTLRAELVTLNGETVAEISAGRAAGGFYWRVWHPQCWIIVSDAEARSARTGFGQDAVVTWGGPVHNRVKAAHLLVDKLHRNLAVRLFGLDVLDIPEFNLKGGK